MKRYWTTAELRMIRDNLKLSDKKLADMLGRTAISIKKVRLRNGMAKGKKAGCPKSLSDEQIDSLWIHRDCIEAIQAGDIMGQVRAFASAVLAAAQGQKP